jgi:hypothetical protein
LLLLLLAKYASSSRLRTGWIRPTCVKKSKQHQALNPALRKRTLNLQNQFRRRDWNLKQHQQEYVKPHQNT